MAHTPDQGAPEVPFGALVRASRPDVRRACYGASLNGTSGTLWRTASIGTLRQVRGHIAEAELPRRRESNLTCFIAGL
jgi:hypothetical protein